ncbi:kinase/pyrophosphorylase [candidate division KSB1 bacterium]|nr:kinase/pyrophosphorylase [candidate division KSB1 bacterium]MBL7094440.1 kinase/pyrophosphorylase [candidate division KSB1 bacterium]
MFQIFVISDGTGKTAEQAINAALTQFEHLQTKTTLFPEVRTETHVKEIVAKAEKVNGFIVHTVVSTKMRDIILRTCQLHNVETIDLMGPLLAQLSVQFANAPSEKPGLFRHLNKAYFQRIEAMEFVLRHDDGQRVHELDKAEIVLLGVSRTFKTPLSIYLAYKGWLVANVPIILNFELPPKIFDLPPNRVIGLTTDARNLSVLRRVRHDHLGGATGDYANISCVQSEIKYMESIFKNKPEWPVIKVTNKPIEEIASEILAILRKKYASNSGKKNLNNSGGGIK